MGIQHSVIEDRLRFDDDTTLNITSGGITISLWFMISNVTLPTGFDLWGRRSGGVGGFRMRMISGGIIRYTWEQTGGSQEINTGSIITANTLYHLVARHQIGTGQDVFINAVNQASDTNTTGIDTAPTENINLNGSGSNSTSIDKSMADVRIYDRFLSNAEITAIFINRGTDKIINGLRQHLPLTDYPKNHTFTGSETFHDIAGGLDFGILNGNPSGFPFPLKAHNQRRVHDVTYT